LYFRLYDTNVSKTQSKLFSTQLNTQNKEDQSLIDKFGQSGDQLWLARLFQKYEHLILGVCLKYSGDPEWSKDLKSQIYEKLTIKAKNLQVNSFKNWLYTFCKNHCLDELRKKKRKTSALDKFRKFQLDTDQAVYFSSETGMDLGQIKSHLQNGKRKMRIFIKEQFKQQA